jgi:D-lactate dehydrogenase (cytochrome)
VGRHKIDLLREELGDDAVAFMRQMKEAWDPHNLMNPGKVVRVGQAAA